MLATRSRASSLRGARERRIYASHRSRIEGFHGEAKTWHGLARAVRRGLETMKIQAYLTAAAINLKRLAAALVLALISCVVGCWRDHPEGLDRKSTRLNSSHANISYAVFCLKKKKYLLS